MKYVLLIVVVAFVLWLMFGRSARQRSVARQAPPRTTTSAPGPAAMIACAHCGVHLPQPEAVFDPEGRPYCGEPHRLAGPRR